MHRLKTFISIFLKQCRTMKYLYSLLFFNILINWILPLNASFWLDETVTTWAIKCNLNHILNRTIDLNFFSIYFWVENIVAQICGSGEIILRLPSFLAMLASLVVLYRIAEDLFDKETAVYTILIFASHPSIKSNAVNARPYAFGVFLVLVGMFYFIRYLKAERFIDGTAFILFSGFAVYTHPFFGEILLVCWVLTAINLLRGNIRCCIQMLFVWGMLIVLLLPAVWIYFPLLHRSHLLVFAPSPSFADCFKLIIPNQIAHSLELCIITAILFQVRPTNISEKFIKSATLLSCWILVPSLTLFSISIFSSVHIYDGRYIITIVPCVAMFLANIIKSCKPKQLHGHDINWFGIQTAKQSITAIFLTIIVGISIAKTMMYTNFSDNEDWRSAIEITQRHMVNSASGSSPVFLYSGLIESNQIEWLSNPRKANYLLAPLAAYPLKGKAFPLPYSMEDNALKQYVLHLINCESGDQFLFIGRNSDIKFQKIFIDLAEKVGFIKRFTSNPKGVFVMVFERRDKGTHREL